jgi:hypothetical protein|tara:strand:+ start:51 stop:1169 length:1119 start_codon:yes stop_codon:yes gene_type:complete
MALNTVSTNRLSTNVKPSNLSSGFGPLGSRNMVINGAMQVNQRGSGSLTVNSSTGQFPCDRWVARGEGGSKAYTIQQVSIASSGQGVRNAIKVTSSQAASVAASDIFNVRQMVEGFNIQRMNFGESGCKSMTLSFTVRSSVAGTHSGAIQNSAQNRSYPFTYTLSANTWTDISVTIPPITSGSFNESNGVGARVVFDMGCGNNFRGTAGQWNSAQDEGATGSVRILETNGATWEVTKVQLEVGTEGTDFEHRSFAEELALCQRYFYKIVGQDSDMAAFGFNYSSSDHYFDIEFPVPMRDYPTYTGTSTDARIFANNIGQDFQLSSMSIVGNMTSSNPNRVTLFVSQGGASAGEGGLLSIQNTEGSLSFSAEI